MADDPHRVVVCGSNYGRVYLDSVAASKGRYRAEGLLARDSDRSRRLAESRDLIHHQEVDELAERYDLACCALSSDADDVVLALVERGLHVLCEHPRSPETLSSAYERAEQQGVVFHVNGHFVDLPSARAFVECCRQEGGLGRARRLELTCQDRALYAALDILEAALEPEDSVPEVVAEADPEREWRRLRAELWGIETAATVHRPFSGVPDGSHRYRVDVRLAVVFDSGTLALQSLAGPVVWNANLQWPPLPEGGLWRTPSSPVTFGDLARDRVDANLLAMDRLMAEARDGSVESAFGGIDARLVEPSRTLRVARAWQSLGRAL